MGMDDFAPGYPQSGVFIVQNVSPQVKTISIFQYPINYLQTRNLFLIPGVGGDDIRESLNKGELNFKIRAKDIIILESNLDLLQFDDTQRAFLQAAGITVGLQVGSDQLLVLEQQDIQLVGPVNGTNTTYTIPSGTWIQSAPYKIIVYKNGVKQVLNDDYMIAQSIMGAGYDTVIMTVPPAAVPSPPDIITADYYISNA